MGISVLSAQICCITGQNIKFNGCNIHGDWHVYGSQIHIFDNYIPFSVRMKEAVREGQSIFSYDPKGKATEAYRRVTEEVLKDAI